MSKIKEIASKKFAVVGILDIPFNEQSRSSLIQIEQNRPLVSWKCQKYVKLIFKGLGTKSNTYHPCTLYISCTICQVITVIERAVRFYRRCVLPAHAAV